MTHNCNKKSYNFNDDVRASIMGAYNNNHLHIVDILVNTSNMSIDTEYDLGDQFEDLIRDLRKYIEKNECEKFRKRVEQFKFNFELETSIGHQLLISAAKHDSTETLIMLIEEFKIPPN